MSNENQNTGGSRMKQAGQASSDAAASNVTAGSPAGSASARVAAGAAAKKTTPRRGNTAKPAELDYERLATMVAGKLAPVFASKRMETERLAVGQPDDIILEDGTLAAGGADISAIDKPLESDYFKALAFMEEDMLVTVSQTEDANAENPVIVGNNGIFKMFFRGHPTVAKRKFVDCLIVKSGRVTTPETLNGAGERTNLIKQHNAHKYPFTVNEDRNTKGGEWLRRRLAETI